MQNMEAIYENILIFAIMLKIRKAICDGASRCDKSTLFPAPSAVNRQPVILTYNDGIVNAPVNDIAGGGFTLNLASPSCNLSLAQAAARGVSETARNLKGVKINELGTMDRLL